MSIGVFSILVFNVFLAIGLAVLWLKQMRPPKEDPRLSRGLQLLQSKIVVLEDLSDRTERQVKQLINILDERGGHLQKKLLYAEEVLQKIEHSIHRSLDVADIFQDKIPHQEIIERNQQTKYVLAAKFANEGKTVDEILSHVDLPRNEVELIAKVNRENLTFDPNLLPDWAMPRDSQNFTEEIFQTRLPDLTALEQAERGFKNSVREVEKVEFEAREKIRQFEEKTRHIEEKAHAFKDSAVQMARNMADQTMPLVRKIQFPKISVSRDKLPVTIKD